MTKSSRFIFLTALSLLTVQSFAQTPLESLRKMFSSGSVTMAAEYAVELQQVPVTGTSDLVLQGDMYHIKGNGLEIFCNGEALWTIDEAAKEVVIEPCDALYDAYMTNPLLLLTSLENYFQIASQKRIGDKTEYVLQAIKDCGISQAQLVIASDGRIHTGKFILEDGNIFSVKVTSQTHADSVPSSSFTPSRTFPRDWIVTDLR